jgi:hypothetical protein
MAKTVRAAPLHLGRALEFIAAGYAIFPCRPENKRPYTSHGFKDAGKRENIICGWWKKWPDALIGLPTGKINGLLVVDVDKKNGKDGYASLEELRLDLSDAPSVPTPSGGTHFFFGMPEGREKIPSGTDRFKTLLGRPSGLDIQGDGKYVIAYGGPPGALPPWPVAIDLALKREEEAKRIAGKLAASKLNGHARHGTAVPQEGGPEEVRAALAFISPDDYHDWVTVLMALKAWQGDAARGLADEWSARSAKFDAAAQQKKWLSLRGKGKTIRTVFKMAMDNGFENKPVAAAHPHGNKWANRLLGNNKTKAAGNGIAGERKAAIRQPVLLESFTAGELKEMVFPQLKQICGGIFVEGCTLFAARPKAGKSWLVLDLAMMVASGGECLGRQCAQGDVLYLALEDNKRRLKDRLEKLGWVPEKYGDSLRFFTAWERGEQAVKRIEAWISEHPNARAVIVDTLQKVRKPQTGNSNSYEQDYLELGRYQQLATKTKVAIIIVHHTRKMGADDPGDTVSGTLALSGAADTILILGKNKQGNMVLHGTGRDIESFDYAVSFSKETFRWSILGDAEKIIRTASKKKIMEVLHQSLGSMTPAEIADRTGLKADNVRQTVIRMVAEGFLLSPERGRYMAAQE